MTPTSYRERAALARAELERAAAEELARPESVHRYLVAARYVNMTGDIDTDTIGRDLAELVSRRPRLGRYGMGPGQIGPRPDMQPATGVLVHRDTMNATDRAELLKWGSRPDAPCIKTENGMIETAPFADSSWRHRLATQALDAARAIGAEPPTRGSFAIKAYPVGSGLPWHADNQGVSQKAMAGFGYHRLTFASSVLLNDRRDFTGGEFAFRDREPVGLQTGDYVAFGGDEWHRVWTVLTGLRVSLIVIAGIGYGPLPGDPRVIDLPTA